MDEHHYKIANKQQYSIMSYWAISHVKMQIISTKALFYTLRVSLQNVGINKKLYSQGGGGGIKKTTLTKKKAKGQKKENEGGKI